MSSFDFSTRRKSKEIKIGALSIGGNAPVSVQTMLNVISDDIKGNIKQAREIKAAGCDIIRVAVPDEKAIKLVKALKENIDMPVVADIHFDYNLAILSAKAGADKIRINPGNIGGQDKVRAVAKECSERGIPIRIGVNAGSLEKNLLKKYGSPTAEALSDSALYHASLLEDHGFKNIILSLKSSNVPTMVKAYKLIAKKTDYPLHLGVTEAGTFRTGLIKSAAGIGSLLLDGIGDTIRFSLTDSPVNEVLAGNDLLRSLGLKKSGATVISCPTCGRTQVNLIDMAKEVQERVRHIKEPIMVAVMGCMVNGPGEGREADFGIAAGKGKVAIFKKGEVVKTVSEVLGVDALLSEIEEELGHKK